MPPQNSPGCSPDIVASYCPSRSSQCTEENKHNLAPDGMGNVVALKLPKLSNLNSSGPFHHSPMRRRNVRGGHHHITGSPQPLLPQHQLHLGGQGSEWKSRRDQVSRFETECDTLEPACNVHVLSNRNWPYRRTNLIYGLIYGLLASIRV